MAVLFLGAPAAWWAWHRHPAGDTYDIVVVGAGPGGVAASLQAARMGRHVALLEPTDWIGGQMAAAGVGTMDEGSPAARKSGIYAEFVQRANALYAAQGKSAGTCYYSLDTLCVDPRDGRAILQQMLDGAPDNLNVFTATPVTAVTKTGNRVTGVDAGGRHFSSKVVIDADEYGDVLALAGATYRLGNTTSAQPAATPPCVQDITYVAVMKQYPHGVPANLTFSAPPPGYNAAVAAHFATYLKQNGYALQVKPAARKASNRLPMAFAAYSAYRGYPDSSPGSPSYDALQQNGHAIARTSLNLGNDYPLQGALSSKYITDPAYRAQAGCQAKLLTLQLAYYIQHDLGQTDWSIANDEGYATPYATQHRCASLKGYDAFQDNMAQEPYVREGRRLIGTETLTGNALVQSWNDKKALTAYADGIAVGYYSMDLHQCAAAGTLESAFDAPVDVARGGPFEVPLGTLVPQTMDGLVAAEKNISASRLANGAIREQPIAMDTGQAAGALAALAVQKRTQPRLVPAADVQAALHAAGGVTSLKSLGYSVHYGGAT